MDENKDMLEEKNDEKKEFDADALVASIFNKKTEEKNEGEVKRPVNIFSKPIPVTQDEEAKKQRKKIALIEGVLFAAFLTSITAIYAISGINLKLDPENSTENPNLLYFIFEFVFFSIVMTVGDYFLTERRVSNYNAKMAGINANIDDEIASALADQEAEGISSEDAAAQNSSNGKEAKKAFIEVKCVLGEDTLADKTFDAFVDEEKQGTIKTEKCTIVDTNGFENVLVKVISLEVKEGDFKNGVAMELINAVKNVAADNTLAAVVIPKSSYADFDSLNISNSDKYKISYSEALKVLEAYPGALMGISGEVK